jgi:YHS domain-containing protein
MAQTSSSTGTKGTTDNRVTDPVCGMRIDPATAAGSSEYKGQRYFFCSTGCKSSFDSDPAKYAGAAQSTGGSRG